MKIKYFNLPILILFLTFNNLLSEEKIPPFKKDSPPKKEDDKNTGKPKKWAYVYSNSFEKFSENYIKRIQTQYDVICVTGLMLRGTGQLRFQKELINKLDKAKIKYRDEEEPEDTKEGTDKKDNQKEDKKEVAENKDNKPEDKEEKKREGAEIIPMVTFSSNKDGIKLLKNENPKRKSIEHIKNFLKNNGFKGIHLDFEGLHEDYAKLLGDYLKEMKEELGKENLKISFAMFPQVDFSELKNFHKPEYIAPHVDEVVLMSYDYHNTKTKAGCVTSYIWSEKNLEELLKHIPANKIYLGLPAYGYEWSINSKKVRVVSAREADLLLSKYVYSREASGCVKITKKDKGSESIIYYSDSETRKKLMGPVNKLGLLGTAIWRLGLEDD